VFIYTVQILLY